MEADLIKLAKESLSIVSTATLKDNEIKLWINAAISDLQRSGINCNLIDDLIKSAIILYVKGNFGSMDIKEKEMCLNLYNLHRQELALSSKYREDSNV